MDDLDRLFAAYRHTASDPEPSAGFTPGIWQRIEARRSPVRMLRRVAEAMVAVAALVALVVGVVLVPRVQSLPVYSATYVDVLAAEHSSEIMAYTEVLRPDSTVETPVQ